MGEHKYNPTAIKAKNGEIPPKQDKKYTKRQIDNIIMNQLFKVTGVETILSRCGIPFYYK